jgi:sugar/nucleoside kinase (ribokinase family)
MIVGLGCLAHDNVLVTETTWAAGKGRIVRRETRFGGNVRNALATIAALDQPALNQPAIDQPSPTTAAYLATVGTSDLSDQAMEDLHAHHIDSTFVERAAGADPVTSILTITADGERYIAFDDAELATTPLPSEATIAGALSDADVLLVDAPTAPLGSIEVLKRARAGNIPVVLDAERDPSPEVLALLELADHVVIPLNFGAQLTERTDPGEICERLWHESRSAVVLTDGANGSHACTAPGSLLHVPALSVMAVDTTGCGDAFHGGYAWSLRRGDDMEIRLRIASAAAAVVASLPPGAPRIPSRDAIAQLIPDISI